MASIDMEHDSLPAKRKRSSSDPSEADPPSKHAAIVAEKPIFPFLRLPQEIMLWILYWLYLDVVYMPSKIAEQRCQRLANWFKFQLPYVNGLFHRLLMPVLLPCVGIASSDMDSKTPLHDLVSNPALLAHLRHLTVDFEGLLKSRFARDNQGYLGHVYLVIAMSSRRLETLELNDLVLNTGGDVSDFFLRAPYQAYEKAKAWQFDLTCTHLVQALADVKAERQLIPLFRQVIEEQRIGFPRLESALLMDGNGGISVKDYANLFLIPRELCNVEVNETQCSRTSTECASLTTACPSLSHLTLVLWYDKLLIDSAFLDAMAHVKRHHKRLVELTLVSRRLRYEPRLLGAGLSLTRWFERDVVPMLRAAFTTFAKHDMIVTIYILTRYSEYGVCEAIDTYWEPVYRRLQALHPHKVVLRVEHLNVREYSQGDAFGAVAKKHRQASLLLTAGQEPCPTQPATWIDPCSVRNFFGYRF